MVRKLPKKFEKEVTHNSHPWKEAPFKPGHSSTGKYTFDRVKDYQGRNWPSGENIFYQIQYTLEMEDPILNKKGDKVGVKPFTAFALSLGHSGRSINSPGDFPGTTLEDDMLDQAAYSARTDTRKYEAQLKANPQDSILDSMLIVRRDNPVVGQGLPKMVLPKKLVKRQYARPAGYKATDKKTYTGMQKQTTGGVTRRYILVDEKKKHWKELETGLVFSNGMYTRRIVTGNRDEAKPLKK